MTGSASPSTGATAPPVTVDADMKFAEPWEAKVFAIIVKLAQSGHFSWAEWVECFSKEVAAAPAAEAAGGAARPYYQQCLNAAETLLVAKGFTTNAQLLAKRFAIESVGATHVLK
jgi:nitrile hydratase accessory protein